MRGGKKEGKERKKGKIRREGKENEKRKKERSNFWYKKECNTITP